jgi:hypothetical protein
MNWLAIFDPHPAGYSFEPNQEATLGCQYHVPTFTQLLGKVGQHEAA